MNFCRPQRSCGKVMFSEACVKNSVHKGAGGGVCPSVCWDTPGQIHTPSPLGQTPHWANIPPTATAADGTHPTGMHSCFSH